MQKRIVDITHFIPWKQREKEDHINYRGFFCVAVFLWIGFRQSNTKIPTRHPGQSSLVSIVSSKYSRLSKQCVHSIWFYKNLIIFKEDLLPLHLVSTYFNMSGEIQNLHLVHGIQQPNLKLRILWSTNLNFSAEIWRGWSMVLVPKFKYMHQRLNKKL